MSQANWAGPRGHLRSRHLRTQSFQDVSGEMGWTTSRRHLGTQSREDVSSETGPTISDLDISEYGLGRMSQAKGAGSA
eukprot:30946-Pyramimonas_sp.AAC.1